jgi:hypothetical protein
VNVRLKLRPAAIGPEFHAPPSAVDVCVALSLLTHVTELPRANLTGLGEYAAVVNADAPITIDTDVPGGVPGVAGGGSSVGEVGTDVDPPQPNDMSISRAPSVAGILMVSPKRRHERRRHLRTDFAADRVT